MTVNKGQALYILHLFLIWSQFSSSNAIDNPPADFVKCLFLYQNSNEQNTARYKEDQLNANEIWRTRAR
jgi:hypothetical protein